MEEQPPTSPPPTNDSPEALSKDDTNMAMLAHLLGILTGFVGPLIIWLVKKDSSPFVEDQAKEALNFQIAILIVYVGLAVVSCVTLGFGALLYIPAMIVAIVFMIMACMAASKGERYRYPVNIRLIK
ncbi:MAG: DUF4870 domain-containing protein [Phycisphaeraceae bacterium]